MTRILRIDASQRRTGSASRALADRVVEALLAKAPAEVDRLDLAETAIPPVTEAWIAARMATPDAQTPEHREILAGSDALVAQLQAADFLVVASPVYNFGIPAPLKAWIDMIARPRITFRYTENGPEGLLTGKKAYLALASGGTVMGGKGDFASPYLKHALGFVGIDDVTAIAAPKATDEEAQRRVQAQLEAL